MTFHTSIANRRMHFFGILFAILQLLYAIFFSSTIFNVLMVVVLAFGFGTAGHYFFEKRFVPPEYAWLSIQSDLRLFKEIATGKIPL
jgi:hypothetical protein